jgi:hypothetical protein
VGKNVLSQKSELQKAMDKHRDQAARKEAEREKLNNKTAFEKVIEERARRLESVSFYFFVSVFATCAIHVALRRTTAPKLSFDKATLACKAVYFVLYFYGFQFGWTRAFY